MPRAISTLTRSNFMMSQSSCLPGPGMMYHSSLSCRPSDRRAGVVFHSGLLNGQGARGERRGNRRREGGASEGRAIEKERQSFGRPRNGETDRRRSRNRPETATADRCSKHWRNDWRIRQHEAEKKFFAKPLVRTLAGPSRALSKSKNNSSQAF